jgi:outer membrane lipoprotein-sorting protein
MKRAFGWCVLVIVLAVSTIASAQSPTAATALANVQQLYAHTSHFTAKFRQTVRNTTFGTTATSDGSFWVRKPAIRADYVVQKVGSAVVTKSFVFDGKTVWLIDHVSKQITQLQPQSSALPDAVAFVTGGTALTSQFAVAFDTSGTYGTKGTVVLRLTPKQPSAACTELFLVVEPSDWHVKESAVLAANGDVNDFEFFAPDVTASVKASLFQVNPAALPGYKIVRP